MADNQFRTGDWVIFRKTKYSLHPGPRARVVAPTERGDGYVYIVDKFWIVSDVRPDNNLRLVTRRGKEHIVSASDPNLRRPTWWERIRYRHRFEQVVAAVAPAKNDTAAT